MNSSSTKVPRPPGPPARRAPVLALFCFLLGTALAVAWFEYGKSGLPGEGAAGLSGDILDQLRHLNSPVQIQFYSVLPPGSASQPVQDFSQRVDRLLSEFQNANDADIQVVRNVSAAETNADAAAASGLRAFNLENGAACFLGITVTSGGQTESLAQLRPEWEPALPFDLARAILRVTAVTPTTPVVAKIVPLTPAITNEVLQLIPNIATATPEDADRIFRQDFVNQCAKAGAEMEAQISAAAQEVVKAQNSGSPAELEAAQKHLSQVQLEQTEKVKAVAAHLQLQLAVFQQLKAAATGSPK
jgi:gas vesicle protein